MNSYFREHSQKSQPLTDEQETGEVKATRKDITSTFQESTCEFEEHSQNSRWQSAERGTNCPQSTNNNAISCEVEEDS